MKIITDENQIRKVLTRRLQKDAAFPSFEEVIKRFKEGKKLRIYLGIDPTGPNLHLGHTIPLLFLNDLLTLGHQPIVLLGTFTGLIGDPSGKESARRLLTDQEIKENIKDYLEQIYKILPKGSFELHHNGDWLSKLNFKDVIELASNFSVQQMLARDMFQDRIARQRPIFLNEFLYPLAQGYDSVAMKVDGEIGGSDQIFNMLIGRELEKKILGLDKIVLATRLLVNASTGKKMSKSEGVLISINDEPKDMYGKIMAHIPDEMTQTVFELCTNKEMELIGEEVQNNPKEFKELLAFELVKMHHSEKEAIAASEEFTKIFSEGGLPEEMQEFTIESEEQSIIDVLTTSGIVPSKNEAKRLLDQGAITVDGKIEKSWSVAVKRGSIIKIGPRRFLKLI